MPTLTPELRDPFASICRSARFWLALLSLAALACAPPKPSTSPAPTLTSTAPSDTELDVPLNAKVSATFDMAMAPLTATTFTVKQGSNAVAGAQSASSDATSGTFAPFGNWVASTVYTATVTSGAKSAAGALLAADHSWSFTTGTTTDSVAPVVTSTNPGNGFTGVATNTKLSVTFSKAMDPTSITGATFTVKQGSSAVAGTISHGPGNTATFTATGALPSQVGLTAGLSADVKDLEGNPLMQAYGWSFTTGAAADTTPPVVSATTPAAQAVEVPINTRITATFSKAMDPGSITPHTFTVSQGTTALNGSVVYGPGTNATFTPANPLAASTLFTAALIADVKDAEGNPLALAFSWTFTTGSTVARGPAVVQLGTAGNFAILAKTAISTVPASVVTGNIGLSPAAQSYITGFSLVADSTNVFATSPQIVGKAYAADDAVPTGSNLTTAVVNMESAYTDAAGRPTPDFLELYTGNLGGRTLAPGLYKWTSTVTLPDTVTLNGGANDVWIFQTSGDLNMSAAKGVILQGGAQAKNIFWQVAGQAVFGAHSHFEGILLTKTDVTLQTGATMNGRALSQTQVALQQATVTQP